MYITDNTEKRDLVKKLFKDKSITFEQALLLLEEPAPMTYYYPAPSPYNPYTFTTAYATETATANGSTLAEKLREPTCYSANWNKQ